MVPTNMPAVSIDINLFWQIINFIVLMIIFNKYLKAPLGKVLASRKEAVVNELKTAEEAKLTALNERKEAEESLKKARKEASQIVITAEKRASERAETIVKEATTQRDKILKAAEVETHKMRENLKKELAVSLRETAAAMAAELLTKKIDTDKKSSLMDEFIDEVGEAKW